MATKAAKKTRKKVREIAIRNADGYVGTIQIETAGDIDNVWFSLTTEPTTAEWLRIGASRAWFTLNLETKKRSTQLAKLTLLLDALRNGLAVRIGHRGARSKSRRTHKGDTFEVESVRILRDGLHF